MPEGQLTLLSGIATTEAADAGNVGRWVMKLAIFAIASLSLGALFVPKIVRFVDPAMGTVGLG